MAKHRQGVLGEIQGEHQGKRRARGQERPVQVVTERSEHVMGTIPNAASAAYEANITQGRHSMKPIRYKEKMVNEFLDKGYWTRETFCDFYEKNARELGEREALVDSQYRVTWAEAKKACGRHRFELGGNGDPQVFPGHHPVAQQRLRISWPAWPANGPASSPSRFIPT